MKTNLIHNVKCSKYCTYVLSIVQKLKSECLIGFHKKTTP